MQEKSAPLRLLTSPVHNQPSKYVSVTEAISLIHSGLVNWFYPVETVNALFTDNLVAFWKCSLKNFYFKNC